MQETDISPKALLAYLKSSFFQWLIYKIYNFDDLFDFLANSVGKSIPFIASFYENLNGPLGECIDELLKNENDFLDLSERRLKKGELQLLKEEVVTHNKSCDEILRHIDNCIFNALQLSEDKVKKIYQDLKESNIYDYDAIANSSRV